MHITTCHGNYLCVYEHHVPQNLVYNLTMVKLVSDNNQGLC